MKISVIGTGYVGLVSGVCLAEKGHDVVCVDVDANKVQRINEGIPPIYEDNLEELLKEVLANGKLTATTDLPSAVMNSELSIIAVGTPFDGEEIDLRFIREVSGQIGRVLADKDSYHVVIVKSTVVPGTTEDVVLPLLEEHSGKSAGTDFGVGMNPEFLKEGEAIKDFMNPDRIVLGGIDQKTIDALEQVYAAFPGTEKISTSPRTAEMIKYAANSLLATLISFSNEIGNLCTSVGGIDVVDVLDGVCKDKRFSPLAEDGSRIVPAMTTYLEAGCGFGGSCFPKDVKALVEYGTQKNSPMNLLRSVIDINTEQPKKLIALICEEFSKLENLKVAVLGLAFKPGTDDVRESPALIVIEELTRSGASVTAYDPIANQNTKEALPDCEVNYVDSLQACIDGCDVVVLVTSWAEFSDLPSLLEKQSEPPLVVDGRRFFESGLIKRYKGIGLKEIG